MRNNFTLTALLFLIPFFFNCKSKEKGNNDSFNFIEHGSYSINNQNSQSIYVLDNKIMDGYYVVGNELSKWEEFEVENGILNGDYIIFHPNGLVFSHTIYKNGKRHGEEKIFSQSGSLKSISNYENDKLYGIKKTYFESGQLESETKIENEKPIESVTYDIIGNISSQSFIKEGRTIIQNIKGGKVMSETISSNYDNFEAVKLYNEDGSLKLFIRMISDDDNAYIIELDENENEIKRVDLKANPQEAYNYQKYFIEI